MFLLVGQRIDWILPGCHPCRVERAAQSSGKCDQGSVDDPCSCQFKGEARKPQAQQDANPKGGGNADQHAGHRQRRTLAQDDANHGEF